MRSAALATCLLGLLSRAVLCQTSALPVQAELLKPLPVQKVSAGATVLAKVTAQWQGPECVLYPGSVLEGKVEASEPRKNSGRSTLALSFDRAQCNSTDLRPFRLVLVAAAASMMVGFLWYSPLLFARPWMNC